MIDHGRRTQGYSIDGGTAPSIEWFPDADHTAGYEGVFSPILAHFRYLIHGKTPMSLWYFLPYRAFVVKVVTHSDFILFSGVDLYHDFRNDAFCDLHNLLKVRKTGKKGSRFVSTFTSNALGDG